MIELAASEAADSIPFDHSGTSQIASMLGEARAAHAAVVADSKVLDGARARAAVAPAAPDSTRGGTPLGQPAAALASAPVEFARLARRISEHVPTV